MNKWIFSIIAVLICLVTGSTLLVLFNVDFISLGVFWKVLLIGAYLSIGKIVFNHFRNKEYTVVENHRKGDHSEELSKFEKFVNNLNLVLAGVIIILVVYGITTLF